MGWGVGLLVLAKDVLVAMLYPNYWVINGYLGVYGI